MGSVVGAHCGRFPLRTAPLIVSIPLGSSVLLHETPLMKSPAFLLILQHVSVALHSFGYFYAIRSIITNAATVCL